MAKRRDINALIRDESGAAASIYALALIGLVVAAGVGYDFARFATMSTELHNAADQAALAAATQLDGSSGAITNANTAARNLVNNKSLLADGTPSNVEIDKLTFFATHAAAENDGPATTDPVDARYVKVAVKSKTVTYALTPIVDLYASLSRSQSTAAAATAGLGSAICKMPPVMMCNPSTDPTSFDVSGYVGKGFILKATGGTGAWAPGDFGFLDVGAGASDLGKLMGYANPPFYCVDVSNPTTQPGAATSVINDFNTRFDIYDTGDSIGCYSASLCPPSDNSRKDVVQDGTLTSSDILSQKQCGYNTSQGAGGNGWRISPNPYRPQSNHVCDATHPCGELGTVYPDAMGYPRDMMHAWHDPIAAGDSRIGDGIWDINAYWEANYGTAYSGQVDGKSMPTRYEVYKWERSNAPAYRQFTSDGHNYTTFEAGMCRPSWSPGGTKADRRILPVAVVDCTGLSGSKPVTPVDWIDVFLVEPSIDRSATFGSGSSKTNVTYTDKGDIYVEVIGKSGQGTEGAENQYVRRDKPFLVK